MKTNCTDMTTVTIIVPPVVVHHLDPHTGIPFMPHIAAYLAGALRHQNFNVQVIDSFGIQPHQREVLGEFMLLGLSAREIALNIAADSKICFIYCRTISESIAVNKVVESIRRYCGDIKICLFENTQAVTSFPLRHLADYFFDSGCDILLMGDPERRAILLAQRLISASSIDDIRGLAYLGKNGEIIFSAPAEQEKNLGALPLPAWDIFPLKGYWIAGFAHAPVSAGKRFLPILTSRGCPFHCRFCIAPALNYSWQARQASNVVAEMEYLFKTMDVREFHISDLNPTVSDKRIRDICRAIIDKKLPITWKLAQGTKIETIKNEETLELMALAGCVYISFSPESGSEKVLKLVNKPFDYKHALRMLVRMNKLGIRTQACFIAGIPGETAEDRTKSLAYMKKLVAAGLDEINVPVFAPIPGSDMEKACDGYTHYAQCTFSPAWRSDYKKVSVFRYKMYITFFIHKLLRQPRKVLREIKGFLTGRFETKMEMSFFKIIKLVMLRFIPWVFPKLNYGPEPFQVHAAMSRFFKPPKPADTLGFYRNLSMGKFGEYVWGKKKRFDPVRFISSPSIKKYFIPQVERHILPHDNVLDVGCGSGVFLPALSPICRSIVGLDISEAMLRESVTVVNLYGLNNVSVVNSQAEAMPFRQNEFDVVLLVDVLHHIYNMEGTLMEIRRVVKPRGKILVFEPNKLNLLLWILCFLDPNERGLLSLGSRRSYRKLFSDHFVIEEMDYNGLLLGADSLLNRGLVNFLSIPIFKRLIGWQHPKIFMVVSLKG